MRVAVVAVEHEDGSGCHATDVDGKIVRYRRPPAGFAYEKEAVAEFRRPFLEQRVDEIVAALRHLLSPTAGDGSQWTEPSW